MSKCIEKDGKFYRMRRGKLVEIPARWLGEITTRETIRQRPSKLHHKIPTDDQRGSIVTDVSIVHGEMMDVARAIPGRPLLHVFASHRRYGGGWRNHGRAQEEALFRSTELPHLQPPLGAYPIDGRNGRTGFVLEGNSLDYVFLPAPPPSQTSSSSSWTLRARAQRLAELASGRDLVTGAWGCGVFAGDPVAIAAEMAAALIGHVASVTFCFVDDRLAKVFAAALPATGDTDKPGRGKKMRGRRTHTPQRDMVGDRTHYTTRPTAVVGVTMAQLRMIVNGECQT